jgi:putative membrane protein
MAEYTAPMSNEDLATERDPRVFLAAERTLLAWVRTGLAMMGFGFVVARFGLFLRELAPAELRAAPPHARVTLWAGTALVVIGVVVNVISAVGHARFIDRFNKGLPLRARPVSMGVVVSLLLAVLGLALCAYLLGTS